MQASLSKSSVDIIKESASLVTSNDREITLRMYEILFEKYPQLRKLFADAPKDQYMKLAQAVSAYAVNIDKIHILMPALNVIAVAHVRKEIKPAHYPLVGRAFIEAMEEVLHSEASLEFIDAWREAFQYLSDILIGLEEELYKKEEVK